MPAIHHSGKENTMTTTTTPGSQRTLTTAPVGTREGTTSSSGTSGVIAGLHAADGRRGGYPPHLRCRVSGRAQGNRADQFDLDKYVVGALSAGASGFLLKDAPPADIIAGIRVVTAGDALLAPSVTRRLLDRFATRPEITNMAPPAGLELLTDREREVMGLVVRGLSNAEIRSELFLSEPTVKTHVGRILTSDSGALTCTRRSSAAAGRQWRPG